MAITHARRGWYVFPVGDDKVPKVKWKAGSTIDPEVIERWWKKWPDAQIGIDTGKSGLVVVDLDIKNGKDGPSELEAMELELGQLPSTLETETVSGGKHLYFSAAGDAVASTTDRVGRGIDTRGQGGFVVAPGSDGYGWVDRDTPIAILPEKSWIRERAGRASSAKDEKTREPACELDTPGNVDRATRYLRDDAPIAIEGDHGDQTTYDVACKVMEMGCSVEKATELMGDDWNERCDPPWEASDLGLKVRNAVSYMAQAPGASSPEAEFPDDLDAPPPKKKRRGFTPLSLSELRGLKEPKWLVDRLVPDGGLAVCYGPPKSFKTFWAMALSLSVATGQEFHGAKVRRGRAIYLAGEGGRARLRNRALAWLTETKTKEPVSDTWGLIANRVDMADPKQVKALIEDIGKPMPSLLVLDTLARCMTGDENSVKDMSAFIEGCDRFREATGAAVLIVHHMGKDASRGARGSSALLGALDAGIKIEKSGQRVNVQVTELRDDEPPSAQAFEPKSVLIDGLEASSAYLELKGSPQSGDRETILSLAEWMEGETLTALIEAAADSLGLTERTARRRVERIIQTGREKAAEWNDLAIWLEADTDNPRGASKTIKMEAVS